MANKTVRITILENPKIGDKWVSSDTDLSIQNNGTTTIIKSDVVTTDCISGNIVNAKTVDLDLTKDVVLLANQYHVTQVGVGYTCIYEITIAGSSSGTHNISMRFKETPDSVLGENIFEEVMGPNDPSIIFSINGNVKQVLEPHDLSEWQSLGTHSTDWNGTSNLSMIVQGIQNSSIDSTVDTGFSIKFELEG
tara:strand:+ start:8726 stop:9304 length:579 start_codon:yes stop_codon:yes gene_type:complete